jgi:plasmid stabilization system protein ParE
MMFRVIWTQMAVAELTAIWSAADDRRRKAIAWAMNDLDYVLSRKPKTEGESRLGDIRIAFSRPLVVLYEVDEGTRTVRIGHVGPFGR